MKVCANPPIEVVAPLLTAAGLPTADLDDAGVTRAFFFVGPRADPDGVAGIEFHGEHGLLRSVVVKPVRRHAGLGAMLVEHLERQAAALGVHFLYVLTDTAESFFARRGYARSARDKAPPAIRATGEFAALCPVGAALMVKRLKPDPAIPVARTGRLLLRRFSLGEARSWFELNADPEVIRYTGDAAFPSVEAARAFLATYDHYLHHGFGRWSVYRQDTEEHLGFCGLKVLEPAGEVDLGFRLHRRHWGQGYATEAARAALRVGFLDYGLERIIGRAMPPNAASIAVLRRLGMRQDGEHMDEHGRWLQFQLNRRDFERPSGVMATARTL